MKHCAIAVLAILASMLPSATLVGSIPAQEPHQQTDAPPSHSPALLQPLGPLSIPSDVGKQEQQSRTDATSALAGQIANENRTWRVGSVDYPFYDGPVPRPGSLAQQLQHQQLAQLNKFRNPNVSALTDTLVRSSFHTTRDYAAFYERIENITATPMSFDTSDENFGYQRLTIKSFRLRVFRADYDTIPRDPNLAVANNIAMVCGPKRTSLESLTRANALFVTDFSDVSKWNQPTNGSSKFVASVIGYFCYNRESSRLLPLAIHVVDTHVTYTPFDRSDEWLLAKMALDAAEISVQQLHHLVETHAVLAPIQIEAMRHLAPVHPVSALLRRVSSVDFGIEVLAAGFLLNASTPLDATFGWGAVGSVQYIGDSLKTESSIANDFESDVRRRGLKHLPIQKYVRYGRRYNNVFAKTVGAYLIAYYASDGAVASDTELQQWARACANVSHLRAFPTRLKTRQSLQTLLTNLLFRATVRHHAMNGVTTWELGAVPFSTPALWKPLPTRKLASNETLDVLAYSIPASLVPAFVTLFFSFKRDVPTSESLTALFRAPPFANESKLVRVIADYESALRDIEQNIAEAEQYEKQPFNLLRPAMLAHNGWI